MVVLVWVGLWRIWEVYNELEVTQPTLVAQISAEAAEKSGISFENAQKPLSAGELEELGGEQVSNYVRSLGFPPDQALCTFALKGYSVVAFEPQQWHGVYLTIHVKKEDAHQIYIYAYDPRYAGAWHLRSFRMDK